MQINILELQNPKDYIPDNSSKRSRVLKVYFKVITGNNFGDLCLCSSRLDMGLCSIVQKSVARGWATCYYF